MRRRTPSSKWVGYCCESVADIGTPTAMSAVLVGCTTWR